MMFDDWEIDHVDFVSTLSDVETRALRVIINALNTVNGDGRKRLVDAATEFFETEIERGTCRLEEET